MSNVVAPRSCAAHKSMRKVSRNSPALYQTLEWTIKDVVVEEEEIEIDALDETGTSQR
jgi:hypothetical protein